MSEVTLIINDTGEILKLALKLLNNAQSKILVFFSTANGFERQIRVGNEQIILKAASRGVTVTLISPIPEGFEQIAEALEQQNENISISEIRPPTIRPYTTLVVDYKHVLSIELEDDSKLEITKAIGQATYSTRQKAIEDAVAKINLMLKEYEIYDPVKWSTKASNLSHRKQHDR